MKKHAPTLFPGNRVLPQAGALLLPVLLPQVLLLAVVLYLFVLLFRSCMAGGKGEESVQQLMRRLLLLEQKFRSGNRINPDAERRRLEALLNGVKSYNAPDVLTADRQLRFHVTRSYNLISEHVLQARREELVPWTQLDALMQDFYRNYFSVLPGPRYDPAAVTTREGAEAGPTMAPS